MKKNRSRWRDPRFIFSFGLAAIIIFVFVISLFARPGTQSTTSNVTPGVVPTPRPTRITVPTPEPDGPQLTLGLPQIQNNGFFQVSVPNDNWVARGNEYDASIPRVRISFLNGPRLAVIDTLLQFGVNYPSLQALSEDFLTDSYFLTAWQEYDGFTETDRTLGNTVTVDFDLVANEVEYLGRQIAWLDQDWLVMVRVITPANNPQLLEVLSQMVTPTFVVYEDQRGSQPSWGAYYDQEQSFLVKHPYWTKVSGSAGTPAVLEDPLTSARLLIRRFQATPLESLDEAESYVTGSLRQGASVVASQVTTRQFGDGFLVSYADTDTEGNAVSGLAALLNDSEGNLLVADLRLPEGGVDLLSVSQDPNRQVLREVIDSFMILPPEGYVQSPASSISSEASPEATEAATAETSG